MVIGILFRLQRGRSDYVDRETHTRIDEPGNGARHGLALVKRTAGEPRVRHHHIAFGGFSPDVERAPKLHERRVRVDSSIGQRYGRIGRHGAYGISVTSYEEVETRRRVRVRPRFEVLGSRGGRAEREKERDERQGPTERRSASSPEAHVESPVASRLVTTSQSMLHLSASRIVSSASFAPSEA
jgi:hypothetical protein